MYCWNTFRGVNILPDMDELINYISDANNGIIKKIFAAIYRHCFYITIDKAHENNEEKKLATNNPFLADLIRTGYWTEQIIKIGNLVDGDPRTIGLKSIILKLQAYEEFNTSELNQLLTIINTNESIDKIKFYRDKALAHSDIDIFGSKIDLNYEDIEMALVIIAYTAKKIKYITTKTIETFSWYPTPELNDVLINLDMPFFFSNEIDALTKYFLDHQKKMDENIRNFSHSYMSS